MGKRQLILASLSLCVVLMMGLGGCDAEAGGEVNSGADSASANSASLDGTAGAAEAGNTEGAGPEADGSASAERSGGDAMLSTQDGEGTSELGWQALSLGDDGVLSGIYAVSAEEAYAVGGHRALKFNGETWASYGTFSSVSLHGVWGGDGVVVVTGTNGYIARRVVGEVDWSVEETGTGVTFRAVAGRDQNDIWAVGDEGTILHYSGQAAGWELVDTSPHLDLHSLWIEPGTENADGILIGGSGGVVMYGMDDGWVEQQVAQNDSILHAVLGVGEARFAVGTNAAIAVKSGPDALWQGMLSNMSKPQHLYGLASAGANEIYAFGDNATVIRYQGSSWSIQSLGAQAYAGSEFVAAAYGASSPGGAGKWFALSATGGGVTRTEDAWVDMHTQPTKGLRALIADHDGNRWAVGPKGLMMLQTDAHGWSSIDLPTTQDLNALTTDEAGNIWVVGDAGTLLKMDSEGGFALIETPIFSDLYAVVTMDDNVVVGGKGGSLWRGALDGSGFLPWALGLSTDIRALIIGGNGSLWMAGAYGQLWRSEDGESAAVISTPVSGNLNHMARTNTGVVIAGDNGVVLQLDISDAEVVSTLLYEEPGLFLYGISVYDGEIIAVGWNGQVIRIRDGEILSEGTGATAILDSVWQDEAGETTVGRLPTVFTHSEAPE